MRIIDNFENGNKIQKQKKKREKNVERFEN